MNIQAIQRQAAAAHAVSYIHDGMIVGLGSGRAANLATEALAARVADGLSVRCVPTSIATANLARSLELPLIRLNDAVRIDVTIDGADEVDPALNLIKGGGGAHTREKLVARATTLELIVVERKKLVKRLGVTCQLPVEVLPFGWRQSRRHLEALGCTVTPRGGPAAPFRTDNGNAVLDCDFGGIDDPTVLEAAIKALPGVIESGLFVGLAGTVIVGVGRSGRIKVQVR